MARIARRGNVLAIRPGIAIPDQREEDMRPRMQARIAKGWLDRAYELAQTEPDSEAHRLALHMAGIGADLPRNNLRLIVNPPRPRREWFDDACRRVRIATAAVELANSQWAHAYSLDRWDGGTRADTLQAERRRLEQERDTAILDALRTPTCAKGDALRKQKMVGKREWAAKYRPEWQAIVDEDLARYATARRARQSREGC